MSGANGGFAHTCLPPQAPWLAGAGSPIRRSKLSFIVGAGATRMHRMQKCVAGSGNIFRPAPVVLGAGAN